VIVPRIASAATFPRVSYTRSVMRFWLFRLCVFALLVAPRLLAQPPTQAPAPTTHLETGQVLPRVPCAANPQQSYALYLPSNYSADRQWPLVLSSDPAARGSVPLELQKAAAEKLGYVLAASNNSRNGPWAPRLEATQATVNDVQTRVSIDPRRIYLAGFSGGARASSQIALLCKCVAGVLLNGAGFSNSQSLASDAPFPVYSAIGVLDFNYSEVIPLQEALAKAGYPHWLRVFEGAHEWAPAEVVHEALAWFRIEAMKSQREARDQAFLDAQFAKMQVRATSFEQSGDLLAAWREYTQLVATFDGLTDVNVLRGKVDSLGKEKAVRDALKREQNDFIEQAQLTGEIASHFESPKDDADDRFEADREVRDEIARLRMNANQEKHFERARIYQRALAGVFIAAMEAGNASVDQKKYGAAIRIYGMAALAQPDSEWAWNQLAMANALAGKSKDAIGALRKGRELAADKAAFAKWLQSEPAFESLRSAPEVQLMLQAN
jgi:dienelactone hydrolase